MRYNGKANDYLKNIEKWYLDNMNDKNINWHKVYQKLSKERKVMENKFDYELLGFGNDKNKATHIKIKKALHSYVYKKEELYAYANHMERIGRRRVEDLINRDNDARKDILEFSNYVNKMLNKTGKLLEEKTRLAKTILFYAAIFDVDASKVYSEDKYEKVEESIEILEDVLNGIIPQKKGMLVPLKLNERSFDYNNFIKDTSDNYLVTAFKGVIKYKKQTDECLCKISQDLETLRITSNWNKGVFSPLLRNL